MFSIIFSLIPFVFIIYYLFIIKKSKSVSFELNVGEICYSCKDKTDITKEEYIKKIMSEGNYILCKSCKRAEKLDKIVNISKLSMINSINLYIIRNDKITKILLGFIVLLFIFDITLRILFGINSLNYLYNVILLFYWLFIIYRHRLISIKK